MSDNLIGDFLRARRALVRPEDVGVRVTGTRRVAGLRREEVAMLAGISSEYYLRLEQGRDRHPSVQVLESLARVLRLDEDAADYLLEIATPKPRRTRRPRRETVPAGIRQLLEVIGLPAFVEGRYFDVLAANALAAALSPNLRPGENRMRAIFLDPRERALYPDWEQDTITLVAGFRESVGNDTDDPRFVQLVGELSLGSERFRQLWARHDVHGREGRPTRLNHPQVGEMTVRREKLAIGGAEDQILCVYHAEPGTSSADKLALLASVDQPAPARSSPRT
ncbi:helix-turn-helix domain-containing protein [Paractinoplanes globisporus]|uniref:Helix-turn-helix domain-containing protein n=1 Tax=Paractinoplanes globisporus TaxID=113565 RepID=A0ABW6WY11_9ACTN|nr:helix-turn-helix transcriptional regulator [Actinoplanes globisporus]